MRVYRCKTCDDVVFVASAGPAADGEADVEVNGLEPRWREHLARHGQIDELLEEEWPDLGHVGTGRRGVPGADLSEQDLMRELARLHFTRHETFLHGSTQALVTHSERQRELEDEYLRRYPHRDIDPERLRAGARQRDPEGHTP